MSIFDIPFHKADGSESSLAAYKNKAVLIVNVASKCGLTPQYEGLERLYEKYHARGLEIIGFPSNDFMGQEPGTDAEIQEFCSLNYGVKFPVMQKIIVKGEGQHPLYAYLTEHQKTRTAPDNSGLLQKLRDALLHSAHEEDIAWNFEKFLLNEQGEIVGRFSPGTVPEDSAIVTAIEALL